MIVDVVRSCYESDIRFFQGSPATTRVSWFFTPEGAQPLPFPTIFGSRNYDFTKDAYSGIGEQRPQGMTWRDGSNPWGYVGLQATGDPEQFVSGLPGVDTDYPIETDGTGYCAECFAPSELRGPYDLSYSKQYDRVRPA